MIKASGFISTLNSHEEVCAEVPFFQAYSSYPFLTMHNFHREYMLSSLSWRNKSRMHQRFVSREVNMEILPSHLIDCKFLAYFYPQKYISKPKLVFFSLVCWLTFYCKSSNFEVVLSMKTWKKTSLKVGYFSKIAEIFSTAQNSLVWFVQTIENSHNILNFSHTWHKSLGSINFRTSDVTFVQQRHFRRLVSFIFSKKAFFIVLVLQL